MSLSICGREVVEIQSDSAFLQFLEQIAFPGLQPLNFFLYLFIFYS